MPLQEGIFSIQPEEFSQVVEVWEASVRATHHFVTEANIQFFKPLVREALAQMPQLACVRDEAGHVAGFIGVANGKVEMLFIDPSYRGQGGGSRLLRHAVMRFGNKPVMPSVVSDREANTTMTARRYRPKTWLDPRQVFRSSLIQGIGSLARTPIKQNEMIEIVGGVVRPRTDHLC